MRKQVRFGIVTAFCAVASLVAHADTVAWWRFEEKAPGEKAAAGTVKDSVNDKIVALPEVSEGATVYEAGTSTYESSAYAPVYASPFAGRKVVDPVSGATCVNNAAMKFSTAKGGSGDLPAYYGGCLKVANTQTLLKDCSSNITIEAFICTTGGLDCAYNFAPIVASIDGTSWAGERWALYLDTESKGLGRFAMRINTRKGVVKYQGNAPAKTINDGVWHHIAYVYHGTAQKPNVKLYIDYVCVATYTDADIESSIPYGENNAIYIGGYDKYSNNAGYRRFPGLIDEVRISDAVLEPAQFLHLVSTGGDDKDVILHIPFEGSSSPALTEGAVLGGTVGGVQAVYHATKAAAGASAAFDTTEKAGASVGSGLYADSTVADASSLCLVSADDGAKGCFVQAPAVTSGLWTEDPGLPVTNFNYTVECFAKAAVKGQVRRTILKIGASGSYIPAHFVTGDSNHSSEAEFCCALNAGLKWTSLGRSSADFDDGEWHHLALVSDATNKAVRVYFDYRLVATESNAYLPVAPGFGLYIGCMERGEGQFFDGWIDDVRVTKRALDPEEFLTTHAVGSATQPLLAAMLERNYEFTGVADSYWTLTGTGAARTGGTAPVFEQASRGALLLDGANGSSRAVNEWSAKMDRSNITFPVSPLYEQDAYTVEFWAKFDGYKVGGEEKAADAKLGGNNHAGVLRFVRADSTTFDWYLFRIADNPSGFQIAIRNAKGTIEYKSFLLENRLVADGEWHHYAVQIARNADNTQCSVMLYADYEPLAFSSTAPKEPQTVAGLFKSATGHRLMVCESTSADYNILGNIDAVRFWRGTPDPSQFLGRAPNGLMLIVR